MVKLRVQREYFSWTYIYILKYVIMWEVIVLVRQVKAAVAMTIDQTACVTKQSSSIITEIPWHYNNHHEYQFSKHIHLKRWISNAGNVDEFWWYKHFLF